MKKVIKLTESQLKQMVKDTVNEQSSTKYFDIYQKLAAPLKPTKDPNQMVDASSDSALVYIWNTGRVMYQNVPDSTSKVMGKMVILTDDSFNIVWDNGYTYNSVTGTVNKTKTAETPKINTINCANQLIDISKGKILKFGCKTQGVKELQTLLDFTKPTGYFGSITKQKVMDFQKKNNLKVDGIVGPLTYKALTPNAVPPPAQDVKEYDDMYDDEEDSYNYLQSLFNTEDDFDGEVLRGDEDGFSNKVRFKQLNKNIKADHLGMGAVHPSYSRKKDIEVPRDKEGKEIKYSPLKSDDLPLDKYLEKKKMRNLDEEDGYDYLNSLFTKD